MFTSADSTYTIRSPQNKEEWDVVKILLLTYYTSYLGVTTLFGQMNLNAL